MVRMAILMLAVGFLQPSCELISPNKPPFAEILSPDGEIILSAMDIVKLEVNAYDIDGHVVGVQFFLGEELLEFDETEPYEFDLVSDEFELGEYLLLIKALDNDDSFYTISTDFEIVAPGIVLAGESDNARGRTYFISSKGLYGWKEVGEATRRAMGRKALRVRIPEIGVFAISAVAQFFSLFSSAPALINLEKARDMVQDYWTCDSSRAKRDFGYEQEIPLEEGIRNTVQWYREQGWLT